MVKIMHEVILKNINFFVQKFTFFALSADELMIIDNQWWIGLFFFPFHNMHF
jgi:hypothetical protein